METYPLVHRQPVDGILGWDNHKPISVDRFLTDVYSISRNLPNCPRILNLCQNRYRFLVGFAAALVKMQTNNCNAANVIVQSAFTLSTKNNLLLKTIENSIKTINA